MEGLVYDRLGFTRNIFAFGKLSYQLFASVLSSSKFSAL